MEARRDMTLVRPSALVAGASTHTSKPLAQRPGWRRYAGHEIREYTDPELRLSSGSTFRLELSGDVEIFADDDEGGGTGDQPQTITYHELVGSCCRHFTLVPKASVARTDQVPAKVTVLH